VAEVGGADAEVEMKSFTSGTGRLHSAYGFNFLYAERLTPSLVDHAVTAWPDVQGIGWPSWAFSNHDAPRAVTRWASAEHREAMARMTMLLLACMRGNIFVYQGEELGLPQAEIAFDQLCDPEAIANWPLTLGRDGARTQMPWHQHLPARAAGTAKSWLPIAGEHLPLAVDVQESSASSQLAYTRRVLSLRNRYDALVIGSLQIVESSDAILAFERRSQSERLLCIFNLSSEERMWTPHNAEAWRLIESSRAVENWSLPALTGVVAERNG
jgi:alpha-glucosidase